MEPNLWQVYKDRGVQLIGVNRVSVATGNPDQIQTFVDATTITFPVGFDLSNSFGSLRDAATVGASSNSVHIIIDRDGKVAYLSRFYESGDAMFDMAPVLDQLLAE